MTPRARSIAVLSVVLGLAGCDLFGPEVGPPDALDVSAIGIVPVVGVTVSMSAAVRDDEQRVLEGQAVSWSTSGGSVSPASSTTDDQGVARSEWTFGTVVGTQTLTVSAGDVSTTITTDVGPGPLATLVLSTEVDTLTALGDTLVITATGRDAYGNERAEPAVSWSSSNPAVASVEGGVVVAREEGTVLITAAAPGGSATATVTVDQMVVGVTVDPHAPVMVIGETLDLSVQPVDARGAAVDTSFAADWSSSDPAVATVSDAGTLTAEGAGIATIAVTADAYSSEMSVDVRVGPRPSITGISPSILAAGDTATITGSAFGSSAAAVDVLVDGVGARVLTVTDSELTMEMPAPGAFPCRLTGDQEVVVDVDDLTTSAQHPVAGAARRTLAVGESAALLGGDAVCNELSEPGAYVISVFNTAQSPRIATGFRLQGSGSAAFGEAAMATIQTSQSTPETEEDPDPLLESHLRILEENLRIAREMPVGTARSGVNALLAAETVGALRTFRIPNLDGNVCTQYEEITARATFVGTHGVIWEDTTAPLAGQMDETWTEVGTEYDEIMHQVLLDYFGDPLVFDDRLDDNGYFYMIFSPRVNEFSERPALGFVAFADFVDRETCASSDGGEIFYGRVPTQSGDGYDPGQIGDWKWRMRSTVIHEVKHITSFANKLDVDPASPNLEEIGLEEATARLAEEFYGRALQGYAQAGNVGYEESIWCELRVGPNHPTCDQVPVNMAKHYAGINAYLKAPAFLSPFGPVWGGDFSYYGSGWQWVRWAIDQSGLPEADVIKPLLREPVLAGAANLADKVGRPIPELLADYTLAFAIDDHPSGLVPARPELSLPSWDTRDIFRGLHDDYAGTSLEPTYPTPWPLATRALSGGSFQVDVSTVYGGGAALFELSAVAGSQLVELLSPSGSAPSPLLGLSVVRVQ